LAGLCSVAPPSGWPATRMYKKALANPYRQNHHTLLLVDSAFVHLWDCYVTFVLLLIYRVDAKLASLRRAAFVQGREPSLSAAMAAPLSHKPLKSPAAAAAAGANPFSAEGGKGKGLPPKPKPSRPSSGSSNGSGSKRQAATNTFTAASDVKSRNKLDSLLRAKEAAAAIKAAVQSGQQYEGTLEQRHHAMRQQLRNQLQDGRVPSAEGMAALQAALSAHLPGMSDGGVGLASNMALCLRPQCNGRTPKCAAVARRHH
jgi:hypothetical protein